MHRALWLLLWLDLRSGLRGLVRGKRTWRQLGLVLMVLLFVGMIAASQFASVSLSSDGGAALRSVRFGAAMPFWALIYLLATWLTAAADRGLVMRPAEIHFLVAGPFTTREILTLNLIRLAYRSFVSSLFLAIVAWAYMPNFFAGLFGIWLVLCVSLLVGMIASLAARKALPRIVRVGRLAISLAAIAVLGTMVSEAVRNLNEQGAELAFSQVAAAAGQTPVGRIVLPPVEWMFAPLQAGQFWPTVPWQLLVRLPIVAALVLVVFAVGGAFGEAATERTDRALARRQASLRSGTTGNGKFFRSLAIPQFGRLGGVGSVAWMEMTQALRLLPRFFLYTAAIVTVILVLPLVVSGERLEGMAGLAWLAGLTSYADFLLLLQLPIGFLGPVSQRVTLKLLPLPTWRIVLGALAGPLLPLACMHALTGGLFAYLLHDQRWHVLQVSLAMLPVAFVLTATINLLGLWDIIKPRALQQRDVLAAGRAMLSVWLFSFMLVPTIILGSLGAVLGGALSGHSLSGYLAGAAVGVSLSGLALLVVLAFFFDRWQPAAGMADEEEQELNR
jgi:hypothetical protein